MSWNMSVRVVLVAILLIARAVCLPAQGTHPITGRPIANVMSHTGADWLERPTREQEEAPDRALDAIGVTTGQTVADVGAGSGYFTVRLAQRVGASGRVFAVDIQPEMIALLDARVSRERLANVRTVLGAEDDPRLPAATADLVLMVDVYHELQKPQLMLQHIKRALAPNGRLVLLEYRKEDPTVPIRAEHKMSIADAKAELDAEGFELARVIDVLPRQHILVFVARS